MNTNQTPGTTTPFHGMLNAVSRGGLMALRASRSVRNGAIALAIVLLSGFCLTAHAGKNVPFSAELTAVFVGSDRQAILFDLEGAATQMGPVTGLAWHLVHGPAELGVFFLEDNSGNSLVCAYRFDADPVLAVGTYEIIGGTGRFAHATGGGAMFVDETHVPGDPFPVDLMGTISF